MHARIFRVPLALLAMTAAIAGCSGSPTQSLPLAGRPAAGHAPAAAARGTGPVQATLRLKIPKRRRRRGPKYVSPATQSASLAIAPASGCGGCSKSFTVAIALTPSSPNCQSGGGATLCTFTFALAPGTYNGTMATYDGPLASGAPTGKELSANDDFPVKIAAGAANQIAVTLDGVPNGVAFGFISGPKGSYLDGVPGSGLTLHVTGAGQTALLSVYAVDADGYTIAGPGAPVVAASTSSSGAAFSATAVKASNVVRVTSPPHLRRDASSYGDALYIALSGAGCGEPTASCSGYLNLHVEQLIAVLNQSNGWGMVYTDSGTYVAELYGQGTPCTAAFDSEGDLFVADSGGGRVREYAFPYSGSPVATFGTSVASSYGHSIAVDPNDGDVAVLTSSGISLYAPPYTATPATYSLSAPTAAAFDLDDNLFVTSADQKLRKFTPPLFNAAPYSTLVGQSGLWYLYLDDADEPYGQQFVTVYVGSRNAHAVYKYDDSLNLQGSPLTMPATIDGMVVSGSYVDISEAAGNVISRFGDFNYTDGMDGPASLAVDSDNALVVLQSGSAVISKYAPSSNFMISQFGTGLSSASTMTLWP
jgi:hypothetical protein